MQDKPIPQPTPETQPFWDACDKSRLQYQECESCGRVQTFPRARCHGCGVEALQWKHSAGRGKVLSFTEVHRGPSIAFKPDQPYLLVIVEMDEGFRLMTNMRDCAASDAQIDMRVRIAFEPRGDEGRHVPVAVPGDD